MWNDPLPDPETLSEFFVQFFHIIISQIWEEILMSLVREHFRTMIIQWDEFWVEFR